ncbi:MAG: NAD-dependent epimerase/dehydratase family protein [Elusimicrobiota bacterium]|jgi:GDP-4-dehydro-6-deoxy-D-mannose reductase
MTSILITGSEGFLGSHLRLHLRRRLPSAHILGLDLRPGPGTWACDLKDSSRLERLLKKTKLKWVFHCAGAPARNDLDAMLQGHLLPTLSLLKSCARLPKPPRVVLSGSAAEFGGHTVMPCSEDMPARPVNAYGMVKASEAAAASYFSRNGLNVLVARIFNLLGPGLPNHLSIASFVRQTVEAENGRRAPILETGDLSPRRDFIDIQDVTQGMLRIAQAGKPGESYNLCSGTSVSIERVVRRLLSMAKKPLKLQQSAARKRAVDISEMRGSRKKALQELGWKPAVSWGKSLEIMLEHERAQYRAS